MLLLMLIYGYMFWPFFSIWGLGGSVLTQLICQVMTVVCQTIFETLLLFSKKKKWYTAMETGMGALSAAWWA